MNGIIPIARGREKAKAKARAKELPHLWASPNGIVVIVVAFLV